MYIHSKTLREVKHANYITALEFSLYLQSLCSITEVHTIKPTVKLTSGQNVPCNASHCPVDGV